MRTIRTIALSAIVCAAVVTPTAGAAAKKTTTKTGAACSAAQVGTKTAAASGELVCTKVGKKFVWRPADTAPGSAATATTKAAKGPASPSPSSTPDTTPTAAAVATGSLKGSGNYKATGTAKLTRSGSQAHLELLGTEISRGPALAVYLTPSGSPTNVDGALRLGKLEANSGDQTYSIPANTDLAKYKGMMIWCDQFGVLFATAALS